MADFYFQGSPTVGEPMEYGVRTLPIYVTFRDAGISIAAAMILFALTRGLGIQPLVHFVLTLVVAVLFVSICHGLRRKFGHEWPFEVLLWSGLFGDERGMIVETKQTRHYAAHFVPGICVWRSGGFIDLAVLTQTEYERGASPLRRPKPMQVIETADRFTGLEGARRA